MDKVEAARLARKCLPKMRKDNELIPKGIEDNLVAEDVSVECLSRLWAGMGYIYDVTVKGKFHIIVKRVIPPPKGRQSFGDKRKAVSYQVEANFYNNVAPKLISNHGLSIPSPYHVEKNDANDQVTICMSRLEGSPGSLCSDDEIHAVLRWMATLHAATWGEKADLFVREDGLHPIGSYWHLDTRPDEHDNMPRKGWEGRLKRAARAIDGRLKRDHMQCCIHGDAKDANMVFSCNDNNEKFVMMYDFQYVGKAPPTIDLAYFFCVAASCGDDNREYLQFYHRELLSKLDGRDVKPTYEELEDSLELAFCDFQRFMSGWGGWGCDLSSVVRRVLNRLDGGKDLGSEDAYEQTMLQHYG